MSLKLLIGLGNPGDQYINTRHNIGFKCINTIIKQIDPNIKKKVRLKSQEFQLFYNEQKLICIKPQTYMNLSGEAVALVMSYYNITPQEICVITDDLDIPFGTARIRQQGGAGTHNGMKSIIQSIGTKQFPRLRLGIGPKPDILDSKDYVLKPFTKHEQEQLPSFLTNISTYLITHLNKPISALMNQINGKQY